MTARSDMLTTPPCTLSVHLSGEAIVTRDEAEAILVRVRRGEIGVGTTAHFWERARQRTPGFGRPHLYLALRTGSIHGDPVDDPDRRNHKIRIRAHLEEFGTIELVAAISWLDDVVCITIYEKR